ncbi:YfhO family protein [Streptomyces sp. NPDC005878]|uniref:YfhO family protein n=1 Tax=Streptomyces sp. NPDC005878 TaxID=3157077 RepID=UPI0033C596F3
MPTLEAVRLPPAAPAAPPGGGRPRVRASALAALVTVVTVCAADALARTFPFGRHTRGVNDLGNQFVPFHAHLWDLLHGRAHGGALVNWQSGYGTSFLPDIGTYLGSPFALLVGVFPRDRIDLAVYVITVLKMAAAAVAMTVLLLALRPGVGRRWVAGVLGAAYALCGWSVIEATYNTMWLDGLIAFPLLCLVGEWARTRTRPLAGPVVVALAWTANFYTAYMATIGAALVLLLRLFLEEPPEGTGARVRARVGALARAGWTTALGIGLSAPLLFTVFLGTKHAYPGWSKEFGPVPWSDFLARWLPATYSFSSPALFLGTGALLLAGALAFHRAVPDRERYAWTGLALLVALSFQWKPTHLAWHAFQTPNGSPYRQTFVLSGILVIAAWICVADGLPDRRALLGGGGVLGVIGAGAAFSDLVSPWSYPLYAGGLAAVLGALVIARRVRGRRAFALAAVVLLAGAQTAQAAVTVAYGDRERLHRLDSYPAWGAAHDAREEAVSGADGWPAYRTDPGRRRLTGNDPLLVGGEGASYYSSLTPDVLTRTMTALGGGWTSRGRSLQSLDNPVTDAVFAVGARVRAEKSGAVTVTRAPVPPLVTVRGGGRSPQYGSSPFRNQELLLGARVYTLPRTVAEGCAAGQEAFLWAPEYTGWARLGTSGRWVEFRGGAPKRRAALAPLGVSAGPSSRVELRPAYKKAQLGCLDRGALTAAVERLRTTGASEVEVTGSGVRAVLPAGAAGTAVFAMPRIAGWRCAVNGAAAEPAGSYLGLVSVELRGGSPSTASCTFRPPGLKAGTAAGAAGLAGLFGTGVWAAVRKRRAGTPVRP